MHCPNCGRKTSPELKFCRACGMKLDSVARAVSSHLEGGEPGMAVDAAVEKKSAGGAGSSFSNLIYIGLALSFIGVVLAVLGQGGLAKFGALIGVLGVFVMIIGALPAAARFDRALLRSMGSKGEPKREEKESAPDHPAALGSGDDFEPVESGSRPVSSVTEGTTRNLDENKTKVVR